jgi:glycosyltransferase involved in cell wall biosynthesis
MSIARRKIRPQLTVASVQQKPLLICYSHLRWDLVFQRPQHLLTRAAKHYRVVYMEEPVFDRDCCARLSTQEREEGVQVVTPHLPKGITEHEAIVYQKTLLNALLVGERPAIGWYYTPMALSYSDHIEHGVCIYDCMDDLGGFLGAPVGIAEREHALFEKANLVFTGGHALYEARQHHHDNIHPFPSSIDAKHFGAARAKDVPEPDSLAHIPAPRFCFFGVIDERLDIELLAAVAKARPAWQFVMIGPVVKIDPASLPKAANIHWLGPRAYKELPSYLAHMDAGLMPFALNAATRFISPTKTPEFLAAGLPVVSTAIRDVERSYGARGLVEIAHSTEEFLSALEKILVLNQPEWLRSVDQYLAGNSWNSTWNAMQALIRHSTPKPSLVASRDHHATEMRSAL